MGLGQALEEEMVWKDGMLMNPGLLEYRSPSSVESPEVECIIVESIDPEGPFGAKECSEGSLAATIPAIAGGSRCSHSAKAGTTIITRTPRRRGTGLPGTSSTSPGYRSGFCNGSGSPGR